MPVPQVLVIGVPVTLAGLVVWVGVLTVQMRRWRRERGDPVFRRLPDGRLRFEWTVANAYRTVRRAADDTAPNRRIG
jgi:hypothetical protein